VNSGEEVRVTCAVKRNGEVSATVRDTRHFIAVTVHCILCSIISYLFLHSIGARGSVVVKALR
jgi:hypothetical protein